MIEDLGQTIDDIRAELRLRRDKYSGNTFISGHVTDLSQVYDVRATLVPLEQVPTESRERIEQLTGGRPVTVYSLNNDRSSNKEWIAKVDRFYYDTLQVAFREQPMAQLDYLDLGCADGLRTKRFIEALQRQGIEVRRIMAVDLSPAMVAYARETLQPFPNARVERADLTTLDYHGEFDLVSCMFAVLGHLPEQAIPTAFGKMYESLREGGYACIDVLGDEGDLPEYFRFHKECRPEGRNIYTYYCSDPRFTIAKEGRYSSNLKDQNGRGLIGTEIIFSKQEIEDYATQVGFTVVGRGTSQCNYIAKDGTMRNHFSTYALVLQK